MAEPIRLGTVYPSLPHLPHNYMPAGLSALRGEKDASSRPVLPLLIDVANLRYGIFEAETINDPDELDAAVRNLLDGVRAVPMLGYRFWPPFGNLAPVTTNLPGPADMGAKPKRAVVIIDVGIAFWNQRFQGRHGCCFQDIVYLDLAPPTTGRTSVERLDSQTRTKICAAAATPGGNRQAVETLKSAFPNSYFGDSPALDGFWHGTAVADLALGDREDTLLFGIELPRLALTDYGGDSLQAILPTALSTALAMTRGLGDIPTIVVLAFGCPAGPHDGTHPVAGLISEFEDF